MPQPAVIVEGLGKRYCRMHTDRPRTFMEAALAGFRRMGAAESFWALNNINFTVMPGQMLGVIGHNGAGKSTLLQILSGIVKPDTGRVQVTGRMGALLDLGSGFHEDLTGRENAYINSVIGGLTRKEAEQRFEQILEFAELEDFIDNPLRTYSAGMQMRLGFSVAIHTEPDVMFIDEFLSVGDVAFQQKCLDRILELKHNGCAIVLISHSAEQVRELCDQAIWLDQGEVRAYGDAEVVASSYIDKMEGKQNLNQTREYTHQATIEQVTLYNGNGDPTEEISSGTPLSIGVKYCVQEVIQGLMVSICISDEDGQIYFNTNNAAVNLTLPNEPGEHQFYLDLARLDLVGGNYFVNIGLYAPDWNLIYDYHWHQHPCVISWTPPEPSRIYPPRQWRVESIPDHPEKPTPQPSEITSV